MVRWLLGCIAALAFAADGSAASVQSPPPPVEDYGKLPAVQFLRLAPSGQRYAFVSTEGGQRKLVVATTDNQLIDAEDLGAAKIRDLLWAGDDHLLIWTSATVKLDPIFLASKAELFTVVAVNVKTRRAISVFLRPPQRGVDSQVQGVYRTAQIEGRWYGFFGGFTIDDTGTSRMYRHDSHGAFPDLYRVDLDTGDMRLAAHGEGALRSWLVGPTGEVEARLTYDQLTSEWRLRSAATNGQELASGKEPTEEVTILGHGRTPDTVLLGTGEKGHDLIRELSMKGGPVLATYKIDEVGPPLFDPVSHVWIGTRGDGDEIPASAFDPARDAKIKMAMKPFASFQTRIVSTSDDFNRMIIATEGGDDSGTYWFVDTTSHAAHALGQQYPTVDSTHVGAVSWVNYKAADGLQMRGVLTLPPGRSPKSLPLVVLPHGGPEAHDSLRFDFWAQAFASRGYAVFQPNFRGSDGYGNAFRDAGLGQWGHKMQTDISDGVAELAREGIVDSKRACIVGGSYGGYAALAGVTVQRGLYRCAVAYGGVFDLPGMLGYEDQRAGGYGSVTRYWKNFMGANAPGGGELDKVSPTYLADRADAPVLLIHGQDDTVVPIDQSLALQRALTRAGKPVELITLPGADHWLLEESARTAMLKAAVAFVVKNDPPDAP